jgi:hypothetical protein
VALVASGRLLGSQLIVGLITFMDPTYELKAWHQFLIYIRYNFVAFLVNAFDDTSEITSCVHVVDYRVCDYFDHGLGLFFSESFACRLRF